MSNVKNLLDAGQLGEAIAAATAAVKAKPTDVSGRVMLFDLLLFAGEWDRADKQLDVIVGQDATAITGIQIYKECLMAERARLRLFRDGAKPEFMGAVPNHVELLLDGINRLRENDADGARAAFDRAEEERPAVPGKRGDTSFTDFRDYNDATLSVLEIIHKGAYVWIPFEQIASLSVPPPKNLREVYWAQAKIEMTSGMSGEVMLPALYARTFEAGDDQTRLGRRTDWQELGAEVFAGSGQKTFWLDGKDAALLELGELQFGAAATVAAM